jgi:hypothetical protein
MKIAHDPLNNPKARELIDQSMQQISYSSLEQLTMQDLDRAWRSWLTSSKHNVVHGLDDFKHSVFSAGASASFGEFISRYPTRRIRGSRSDFILTRILCRTYQREFLELEVSPLQHNDAVIISLPFSGNGAVYPGFEDLLARATQLEVPVFLDAAYFGISHDVTYILSNPCITDFVVSLSKNLSGRELRLGMRFTRDNIDDGISAATVGFGIFDKLGAYLSIQLLNNFSHNDFIDHYKPISLKTCNDLGLIPTNVISLAIGPEYLAEEFKRGDYIRVCISEELSRTA